MYTSCQGLAKVRFGIDVNTGIPVASTKSCAVRGAFLCLQNFETCEEPVAVVVAPRRGGAGVGLTYAGGRRRDLLKHPISCVAEQFYAAPGVDPMQDIKVPVLL